jgi:hypothetical protein
MSEATSEPSSVRLQATKTNVTVHLGDGRKLRGPYMGEVDGEKEEIPGEIAEDVPTTVAEQIVKSRLGKIVK